MQNSLTPEGDKMRNLTLMIWSAKLWNFILSQQDKIIESVRRF